MIEEQLEITKESQKSLRTELDAIVAELRAKGQGLAVKEYEKHISVLD